MRRRIGCLMLSVIAITSMNARKLAAQAVLGKIYVFASKLSPPKYPPLARTARISGDVKLELQLRQDGTVSSVRVISGHPLLAPAAIESAKASQFTCDNNCVLPSTYVLTYTFGFREDGDCGGVKVGRRSPRCLYLWKCKTWYEDHTRPAVIIESRDRVTVGADTACVEPDAASKRNQK